MSDLWFYIAAGLTLALLAIASWQDVKTKTIAIWLPCAVAVPGLVLLALGETQVPWKGALLLAGVIVLYPVLTRERLGLGDALLLVALIPGCGVSGVILVISCAATLAVVHLAGTLALYSVRRKHLRELPFVPFIAAGYALRLILILRR